MPCDACPVRPDAPNPCPGLTHPPLCRLVAAGQPGRADQLIAIAEGRNPASGRPVAEAVRLSLLRNACPAAAKAEDCGCSDDRLCARRDGARVDRETCFRCIQADEDRR